MLSLEDREAQLKLIDFSLNGTSKLYEGNEHFLKYIFKDVMLDTNSLLQQAIQHIFSIINANDTYVEDDQSINWKTVSVDDKEQIMLVPMDDSFYNGLAGLGVSLIDLFRYNHQEAVLSIIEKIATTLAKNLTNDQQDYNYYSGKFGILSFFYKLHATNITIEQTLNTESYLKHYLSVLINQELSLNEYDVMSGYAGIIIMLFNHDELKKKFKLELLSLGEIMLNDAISIENRDFLVWSDTKKQENDERLNAGFSHGNSGIATALLYLYTLEKDVKWLDAFYKTWNFEKRFLIEDGWIDIRNKTKKPSAHWCHGSTGIALARMEWLKIDDYYHIFDTTIRKEIEDELTIAIQSIFNIGLDLSNFCLCHGIIGNLDVLLDYQRYFKKEDTQLKELLMKHYRSIADFGLEKGFICGLGDSFYSYGLMTGIAGVMQGFLRVLDKEISSVLIPSFK